MTEVKIGLITWIKITLGKASHCYICGTYMPHMAWKRYKREYGKLLLSYGYVCEECIKKLISK